MVALIEVEVAYALPHHQIIRTLKLQPPVTVERAIDASGLLDLFTHLRKETLHTGVFGHPRSLDFELGAGDRVEIYRPLETDPREARRLRTLKPRPRKT